LSFKNIIMHRKFFLILRKLINRWVLLL
jgi:hypothetical protein